MQSNNGLHPTAIQRPSYRELSRSNIVSAAGDAGRSAVARYL